MCLRINAGAEPQAFGAQLCASLSDSREGRLQSARILWSKVCSCSCRVIVTSCLHVTRHANSAIPGKKVAVCRLPFFPYGRHDGEGQSAF